MGAVSSGRRARAQAVKEREEHSVERPAASYSGRLLLRMPSALHADLAAQAEREGVSLNSLITSALEGLVKRPARRKPTDEVAGGERAASGRGLHPRLLTVALVVNFVMVALVAAIAIGLLVTAWRRGW